MKTLQRQQWLDEREFVIQRINETNEWRRETVLHSETLEQRKRIDARVLELREKLEKKNTLTAWGKSPMLPTLKRASNKYIK